MAWHDICHVISYRVASCRIVSYHVAPHRTVSYRRVVWNSVASHCIALHSVAYIISYRYVCVYAYACVWTNNPYANLCLAILQQKPLSSPWFGAWKAYLAKSPLLWRNVFFRSTHQHHIIWQLPDGVRTNGVITEVPQFPIINFPREMWQMWQNILDVWHFCVKESLSRPRPEAVES